MPLLPLLSAFAGRGAGGDAAEAAASESAAAFAESTLARVESCVNARVESRSRGCPEALSVAPADAPVVGMRFLLSVVWV